MEARRRTGTFIRWENNLPVLDYGEPVGAAALEAIIGVALAQPYKPKKYIVVNSEGVQEERDVPGEEQYQGLTKVEAMAVRYANMAAHGDMEATKFIYDRMIGKPKQKVENINLDMTFQDYLEALRKTEDLESIDVEDVTEHTKRISMRDQAREQKPLRLRKRKRKNRSASRSYDDLLGI